MRCAVQSPTLALMSMTPLGANHLDRLRRLSHILDWPAPNFASSSAATECLRKVSRKVGPTIIRKRTLTFR